MSLIDSHCHFDFSAFDKDRKTLWQQCQEHGIEKLVIPGISVEQWDRACQFSETMEGVFFAAGLHPWWIDSESTQSNYLEIIKDQLAHPNCVAVGECGLDGMIETPLAQQTAIFEQHIALACDSAKPLIIHSRKAHSEILSILKQYRPNCSGVIHGFSGSLEIARAYWQLGFCLGVGGTITYLRATKTRQAIAEMPLEALVLETDAPDMPLDGRQGERNSPLYLPDVAKALAELKQQPVADIVRQTTDNSCRLFAL